MPLGEISPVNSWETDGRTCPCCSKEFCRPSVLKRHWIGVHKLPADILVITQVDRVKPHVCHICSKGFTRKASLNDHLEKVHDTAAKRSGRHRCPYGDCRELQPFMFATDLIKHCERNHKEQLGMTYIKCMTIL